MRRPSMPRAMIGLLTGSFVIATLPGAAAHGSADAAERATSHSVGTSMVAAEDATIELSGWATASAEVEIYDFGTHEDPDTWAERPPVTTVHASSSGEWSASVPRFAGHADRAYDKFLAVTDDAVAPAAVYATPDFTAVHDYPFPDGASKKGLGVQMTDDAEELGASHTGVNVVVNRIMLARPEEPDQTIAFEHGGRTYWFSAAEVDKLDRQIKPMSDNGMVISMILLLQDRPDSENAPTGILIHPDAHRGKGLIYAFNTETADGVAYFTAAMEFLAQRYTRADEAFGRVVNFIVGNEVDAHYVWQNMGDATFDEFMEDYTRAVRIVDVATRKAYERARTYISLTGGWNNPQAATDPHFFTGRQVVDALGAISRSEGDFGWHVAYHAYPEDLYDPEFWKDENVTADPMTTHVVNFKNLEVLTDYLRRPELARRGHPRRVILSEQGFHTPTDRPRPEAERVQAAAYAYAYYRVRFADGIDGFHLHRHVDFRGEGAPPFLFGVWRNDSNSSQPNTPYRPKYIYDVLRYIDTERSLEVTEFAKEIIGIDDWSEVVPGFDPQALAERPIRQRVGVRTDAAPRKPVVLADFSDGLEGWRRADNAVRVSNVHGALRVDSVAQASLWRGADTEFADPLDATTTPWLSLRVGVPAASASDPAAGRRLQAKIKVYSSDGTVAEGVAALRPGPEGERLAIDLRDWPGRREIVRLKVWVRGEGTATWASRVVIDDVALAGNATSAKPGTNLEMSAEAAVRTPDVGGGLTVTVTMNDVGSARGSVVLIDCAGIAVEPRAIPLAGLATGESATARTTVTAWDPEVPDEPMVCGRFRSRVFEIPITLPDPVENTLFGFEDGTVQGWWAGEGVDKIEVVERFPNGPTVPRTGGGALQAVFNNPADAPHTVVTSLDEPLDLSGATEVYTYLASYGLAADTTYEATISLRSGAEIVSQTLPVVPNVWNRVAVEVGSWPGRSEVTGMELSFRATNSSVPWWAAYQVDDIGYVG